MKYRFRGSAAGVPVQSTMSEAGCRGIVPRTGYTCTEHALMLELLLRHASSQFCFIHFVFAFHSISFSFYTSRLFQAPRWLFSNSTRQLSLSVADIDGRRHGGFLFRYQDAGTLSLGSEGRFTLLDTLESTLHRRKGQKGATIVQKEIRTITKVRISGQHG